jgi:hypothetical protein
MSSALLLARLQDRSGHELFQSSDASLGGLTTFRLPNSRQPREGRDDHEDRAMKNFDGIVAG